MNTAEKLPGVTPVELQFILAELRNYLPGVTFYFFGSRVVGGFRGNSDLDVCIRGKKALDLVDLSAFKEKLAQSALRYNVDVSDWNRLTTEFAGRIEEEGFRF